MTHKTQYLEDFETGNSSLESLQDILITKNLLQPDLKSVKLRDLLEHDNINLLTR